MREWENVILNELDFIIETEINDEFNDDETIEKLSKLTKKEKEEIASKVIDDNELNEVLNETIKYYLYHERGL